VFPLAASHSCPEDGNPVADATVSVPVDPVTQVLGSAALLADATVVVFGERMTSELPSTW
jgi:hypothetical protein